MPDLILPKRRSRRSLKTTLQSLGLTPKLCLDVADRASYAGSGKWLDLSGNGYDFTNGSPTTFTGTVGGLSGGEYWAFDGDDRFDYDTANETWMNNMHKDSAAFTALFWVYVGSSIGTRRALFSTATHDGTTVGVMFYLQALTNAPTFFVGNGLGTVFSQAASSNPSASTWSLVAVAVDEASNAMRIRVNSSETSASCTYSAPVAASASTVMALAGSSLSASYYLASGSRMSQVAFFDSYLSASQLEAVYQATRSRFGV